MAAGGFVTGVKRLIYANLDSNPSDFFKWVDAPYYGNNGTQEQYSGQAYFVAYVEPLDPPQPGNFGPEIQHDWSANPANVPLMRISFDPRDNPDYNHAAYYYLNFVDNATDAGSLRLVGGHQTIWNSANGGPDETLRWGVDAEFEIPFYHSRSYNNSTNEWADGTAYLHLKPATAGDDGYRIVGLQQNTRDEASTQGYVTTNVWGDLNYPSQLAAVGKSYAANYGWGFSEILLFLAS
ncbi:MAG TPA: hypothetical protein VH591_06310 [Ktedonobacterales bacterium]